MLAKSLKKLILVRLFFGALLLHCPQIFHQIDPLIFYSFAVGICAISVVYIFWYLSHRWLRQLALSQILIDVLYGAWLVYYTGGPESILSTSFVLIILSSALVLANKRMVSIVTGISCVSYLMSSQMAYSYRPQFLISNDPVYFLYAVTTKTVIFMAVGHLSRRLCETLSELQDRLKLSERLSVLGEVVSKIAHEVRNPLSAIRTAAEVLQESLNGKLDVSQKKMMTIIGEESDRLAKTLQRILNYTKQAEPSPKMLVLDSLVDRALLLTQMNSLVHSKGIMVEKKYDSKKVKVYADEEQMVGALLNLVLNAYQAMPQGGMLRIEAAEEVQGTRVDIVDSGGGIPRDRLKEIFTPFKTSKRGGTGLGLAEVHKIVAMHEGKIDVESVFGKGTTFHLYFPKP